MDSKEKINKKFLKEIQSGTASLILLSVMQQADEPMYGYQIAKSIEEISDDLFTIKQGALYPVLRSLESNELLESRVEPSVSGPPRRYYQITSFGEEILQSWLSYWDNTKIFVDKILQGETI